MKKFLSLTLVLVILVGLCGCAVSDNTQTTKATEATPNSLKIGYGRVDITPEQIGLPMPSNRHTSGVVERLYATCVAFTDAYDNTLLMFHLDLQSSYDSICLWARKDIMDELNIPANQIMFGATHMHRGPACGGNSEGIVEYCSSTRKKLLQAAKLAVEDRKPAEMYISSFELEGFNFVKHYLMSDGSYAGDNFGSTAGKTYVRHESEPDRQMQLIKFVRQGGDDVIMVNWQAHPHRDGIKKDTVSTDVVGPFRDTLEALMDCKMAFFQGAAGNLNSSSRIKSEMVGANYIEQGTEMGKQAAAKANFEKVEVGKVQSIKYVYKGTARKGKYAEEIDMYAHSIGDVAFIMAPYEMFSGSGEDIKDGSPFKMTFICGYSNGYVGYMPEKHNYFYGDIESYEATCCPFVSGTAEELVAKYVDMLKEIYPTSK